MYEHVSKPISIQWNQLTLDAIRYSRTSPPLAARALAMVHTAMYDAWSIYNPAAISSTTQIYIKADQKHCSKENVRKAFSYAAYRVLMDLFWLALPAENKNIFTEYMCRLGYDPYITDMVPASPEGIGNLVARITIECRKGDGSNPHGTLSMPAWSDYTYYKSVNSADELKEPDQWQPLKKETSPGVFTVQSFLVPHWGLVKSFALPHNWKFRPEAPYKKQEKEFIEQAKELIDISACLTEEQKAIAEYWADGPGSYTPPGHWCEIAQYVLRNEKRNTPCIKLFFALTNALLDAGIATWECKRYYNYARPVSVIRHLFAHENIQSWAGPCKGTRTIKGSQWKSYIDTPAFPEHVSGHSTFSKAAAVILRNFTGSDSFGACYVVKKGSSQVEKDCNVPCTDITLDWPTFSSAAEQAGLSRLYGGIHFRRGNEWGQKLGNFIGTQVWEKALLLFNHQIS